MCRRRSWGYSSRLYLSECTQCTELEGQRNVATTNAVSDFVVQTKVLQRAFQQVWTSAHAVTATPTLRSLISPQISLNFKFSQHQSNCNTTAGPGTVSSYPVFRSDYFLNPLCFKPSKPYFKPPLLQTLVSTVNICLNRQTDKSEWQQKYHPTPRKLHRSLIVAIAFGTHASNGTQQLGCTTASWSRPHVGSSVGAQPSGCTAPRSCSCREGRLRHHREAAGMATIAAGCRRQRRRRAVARLRSASAQLRRPIQARHRAFRPARSPTGVPRHPPGAPPAAAAGRVRTHRENVC